MLLKSYSIFRDFGVWNLIFFQNKNVRFLKFIFINFYFEKWGHYLCFSQKRTLSQLGQAIIKILQCSRRSVLTL